MYFGRLPRVAVAAQPYPGLISATPMGSSACRASRGEQFVRLWMLKDKNYFYEYAELDGENRYDMLTASELATYL
jgi:hypothetical protein